MTERADGVRHFEDPRGLAVLWFGLLAGPIGWFLHLNVSYSLVRLICRTGETWLLHVATLTTLALAALGVWVAWRSWLRIGRPVTTLGGGKPGRVGFMALGGIAISGFFLVVILLAWLPSLMLNGCADL